MARLASTIPFLAALIGTTAAASDATDAPRAEPVPAAVTGLDAAGSAAFADDLLRNGDPYNALTFYRLSAHLDPATDPSLGFRIALCYELGDRFAAAEEAYLDLAGQAPDWSARATWRAALAARGDGRYAEAELHLSDVALEGQGTELATRAEYLGGVLALEQFQLDRADTRFTAFAASHPDHPWAARVPALHDALTAKVPRRSPALAGALSLVLPGSGQLYGGHPGDAVMAFLSSGVLGLWSYSLIRSGMEDDQGWRIGTGAALGTVAAFTWTSNVFGAVRGARRANTHLRRRRAEVVLKDAVDPELQLEAEDVLRDPAVFE